jgi:uncharacterized protein (TIGR02118 family)
MEENEMIRALVLYPNETGKKFDLDYYLNKHMVMLHQKLDPHGLVKAEVDKGLGTAEPNTPPPFVAICNLYFNNIEEMQKCLAASSDLLSDVPNFTDIQPQMQFSEVL